MSEVDTENPPVAESIETEVVGSALEDAAQASVDVAQVAEQEPASTSADDPGIAGAALHAVVDDAPFLAEALAPVAVDDALSGDVEPAGLCAEPEPSAATEPDSYHHDPSAPSTAPAADTYPDPAIARVAGSSGEEDEEIIWAGNGRLFRYEKSAFVWKERGVGKAKLLRHRANDRIRFLMRHHETLLVLANHLVMGDMELTPSLGSDRAWVWNTVADIADGPQPRQDVLAIRFPKPEEALDFKRHFDESVRHMDALIRPEDAAV